ncbi:MAG TPA: dihydrodipicolinate synthase family protein, partial [Bauldia sp.]|nr:dihydrodipicolinate synthase family protein [Bauldia sp.]
MLEDIKGTYIVAQTPFDAEGRVDEESIDSLTDFYIRHGADGFTVLGVSGEAGKLSREESVAVARRFVRRAGGRPVIVGVSNANLSELVFLSRAVMDDGATAVMIAPPPGLRTEEEILNYYAGVIARTGDIPVVLQDFPFHTGVFMSVPTMQARVERHPEIGAIKEEDLPSLGKITKLRETARRRVAILTGNNGLYLPLELGRGADGPMCGFSYPEMLSGVYRLVTAGDVEAALDLFDLHLPLLPYEALG